MPKDWGLVTPWRVRAILISLGTILISLTIIEMYIWWVVRSFIELSFIAGILMSLPTASLLVIGGYWLPRTSIPEQSYRYLLIWTIGGMVIFGGFSAITGFVFFPEISWAKVGSIRWGTSVGAGTGWFVGFLIVRGINQRVTAERAAIRAEEAQDKQELLEYLNALLRHEVLNTSNIISGYASLLGSKLDDNEAMQEYTEVIEDQSKEIATVIKDVQILLQASNESPNLEAVNLRPLLKNELENIQDRYKEVETNLNAPSEIHVEAEPIVRRIFSNLLRNAIEHNNSESKRVSVTVTQKRETVTIEISDNGPGVPKEDRKGIFDPEIKQTDTHGLGLTIVGRLVKRYGGNVELKETGPDGTVFAVTLPTTN